MRTQPTNSEVKEINSNTALKEYYTDNTFQVFFTVVVMHFCSITKPQSTNFLRWPLKHVTIQ
jgi:hypothetical protein